MDDGIKWWQWVNQTSMTLNEKGWQPIDENTPHLEDLLVKSPDHKPVIAWHGDGSPKRPYEWRGQYSDQELHFTPTQWMKIPE